MELREYLLILKKRWMLILVITFITTSSSAVFSFFIIKPMYKSDISVIIGKVGTDGKSQPVSYDDILMYQMLVKTYSGLASSRTVAEDVINKLKLKVTPEQFEKMITINSNSDTEFLNITVRSKDPEEAMLIANQLAKSLKEVSISVKKMDDVQILDPAQLPTAPDSPRPVFNISIAFFLGLAASIVLILLIEYLDNTVKTQEDIEKLARVPVIGIIPNEGETTEDKKLISIKAPKSLVSEAYRTLRTSIQFSSFDKKIETIVVTSSKQGEGKTTIVSNLAITTAQSGKKVLLIDCDLRRPRIYKKLGILNREGLTNIVAGERKKSECIRAMDLPNLHVITSGPIPPNPAEILGSIRMKNLLKELKEDFDMILIDTPPVLAVTDAQILSTLCDGVLLVACCGETDRNDLIRAKELIDKVGGKVLGAVINKASKEVKQYNSYY
ncbi:polysaccharide biosynthesis tyrosine autokinase [Clostridium sp. YIM B02515]|uniref:non-specific protein-tyrosine kinase n=1 Tax=Clostridium rhizosphaerae TaxID=2803861 RepID=A0ABS1T895_9CLOT|nr:polysaccharide biosynthesis tyrosine autokinase [Clostridium rhizosphaerae]MBL4934987.1 polysaccharide biosynthesis tyrosine autokinase [Clostridium rhizosphaerae]